MKTAEITSLITFPRAAARDFVSGTTSNKIGYKMLTGITINIANTHISPVINNGLFKPVKATKPRAIATMVATITDMFKHFR